MNERLGGIAPRGMSERLALSRYFETERGEEEAGLLRSNHSMTTSQQQPGGIKSRRISLHDAARDGAVATVLATLRQGIDPSRKDSLGCSGEIAVYLPRSPTCVSMLLPVRCMAFSI